MPGEPPRKLPALGWAGFEASSSAAGTGRRKSRWPLNPMRAEASASAEAARFSNLAAAITRGLGRKPE
jgi:hypothetical protein